MTGRLDQMIVAFTDDAGMAPVAWSFSGREARFAWHDKLREHVRLLSQPDRVPPPAAAFSHLDFGDGTAALVRRSARPADKGRGVAHALIGSGETIARMAPQLTAWDGWQEARPAGDQLDVLGPHDFTTTNRSSEVDREMLVSILATVRSWQNGSFSVIGVPDELRLPVVWRIREVLPDQVWTFSTYEQDDAPRRFLPRLVFLSEPPGNFLGPESGRVRTNVTIELSPQHDAYQQAEALLDCERQQSDNDRPAPDEQPTMVIGPVATPVPPPPPPVAEDEWDRVLHHEAPLLDGLSRLAELVRTMDRIEVRERGLAAIADPRVHPARVNYLAEHLTPFDRDAVDQALGRRSRADVRVYEPAAVTAPAPPARPEIDAKLVDEVRHRQQQWSETASRSKTKVFLYRLLGLVALIMGAIGAVLASQLAPVDQAWMIVVGVTTAAVVSIGTWLRTSKEPKERQRWADARRSSEEITSELCTYLVGAGRYRTPNAAQLLKKLLITHEGVSGPVRRREHPPKIHDLDSYVRVRVTGQIDYHQSKADRYETGLEIAKVVEVGFGFMAAMLSLLAPLWGQDIAVWAGVCTAIAGIVAAHVTQIGYQRLCARYRRTAKELRRLLKELPDDPDHAAGDAFVAACERVLVEQNDDWHAHLTPLAGKEQP